MTTGEVWAPRRWWHRNFRVPLEPAGRWTHVWRQVRQLGVVHLRQAAAILPDQSELNAQQGTLARFNRTRDEEYAELVENVEHLADESPGKATRASTDLRIWRTLGLTGEARALARTPRRTRLLRCSGAS